MSRVKALVAFALLASSAIGSAEAQSVKVSPISIELSPGVTSSVLTLETDNNEGVAVQARVFRWSQADGVDKLEKTEDVVISPPSLTIRAGAQSTLRLVRVSKTPVSGEETYRVLIDEIPDRKKVQSGSIVLQVRQSLPVFFAGLDVRPGSITWKAVERNRKLFIEAANAGQKRVKVLKLSVFDEKNHDLIKAGGLSYVLGGQARNWELVGAAKGKSLTIRAETDAGPINASVLASTGG